MKMCRVLQAPGRTLVVLSVYQRNTPDESVVVELVLVVKSEVQTLHQDHGPVHLLAILDVSHQPDEVVLQPGNTANLVLQLLPRRIELPVGGFQVFRLDDLKEGVEGDGSTADGHVYWEAGSVMAVEEVKFLEVGLQYAADGLEESLGARLRQVPCAVVEQDP